MGYQCPFIVNFTKEALALTHLLKDVPWSYREEQQESVHALKRAVYDNLELVAPDTEKPFKLQTDASAFALGAILFQNNERGKKQIVGAVSHTLIEPEQNYDIWDQEFMGFVYGLNSWKHLLASTSYLFKCLLTT